MEVAHNNGPSIKEQQLTKGDVSVLVDKCVNFVYTHGKTFVHNRDTLIAIFALMLPTKCPHFAHNFSITFEMCLFDT